MQALKYAKSQGAMCLGVTNTVGSAIASQTACGIHINAGCEIGVASTKAYTCQIVALTLLGLTLAEDSMSHRAKYDRIVAGLRTLPGKVRQVWHHPRRKPSPTSPYVPAGLPALDGSPAPRRNALVATAEMLWLAAA